MTTYELGRAPKETSQPSAANTSGSPETEAKCGKCGTSTQGGVGMAREKDVTIAEDVCVRQQETDKVLPKTLPGAVCWQRVRCGKPGCKCQRGELHGPYAYRFERVDSRLRKRYIPKADVAATIAECERHREEERIRRAAHRDLTELLRGYTATCREVERWIRDAR